ncbi:MAG TPA: response regulator [Ignavibacteriales bacterium]|nr:response regulator [Ignavibacteriales bacterium]
MKVLIVDDSDIIRKVMKTFFEDFNIEVVTCNNGLLGIKNTLEEKPDFVFLDLNMPGMNGYDTLKVVKNMEQTKHIPVIVITSLNNQKDIDDLMAMGASRVLFKPLKKKEIVQAFEDIWGNKVLSEMKINKLYGKDKEEKDIEALSERSETEIRIAMVKLFLKTADLRKQDLKNFLELENYLQLKHLVHELRGIGGTIGYPRLTLLSEHVENMLAKPQDTFKKSELNEFCGKILSLIEQIIEEN